MAEEGGVLYRENYEKFLETGSLTKVDAYLLERGKVTKKGNQFTRFAIKNILMNPVYMIADKEAYEYLLNNTVDLFSSEDEFNGMYGIMAYNRTLQRKGKSNQQNPMNGSFQLENTKG